MDTTPCLLRTRVRTAVAGLVAVALAVVAAPPALAAGHADDFVARINGARASSGLPALTVAEDLADVARRHSHRMAASRDLHHNPNLGSEVSNWRRVTENVGRGVDVDGLHRAFMDSSGHRANILDAQVSQVGVGVVVADDGTMWVTQVFRDPMHTQPEPAPAPEQEPGPEPASDPTPAAEPEPAPAPAPASTSTPAPEPVTVVPAVDAIRPAPDPDADARLVHVLEMVEALDGSQG